VKVNCICGELFPCLADTEKYVLLTRDNWNKLIDTVDSVIEGFTVDSIKDDELMRVRYAMKKSNVWECYGCRRLITIINGDVVFLTQETA